MNIARQIALGAGMESTSTSYNVSKVCGSGLKAVSLAAQSIACGDADVVLAGGAENMSQAPYVMPKARWGQRMGHGQLIDTMISDGLTDVFKPISIWVLLPKICLINTTSAVSSRMNSQP